MTEDSAAALARRIKRRVLGAPQTALVRFPKGFGDVCHAEVVAALAASRLKTALDPTVTLEASAVVVAGAGFADLLGLGLQLTTAREILWPFAVGRAETAKQLVSRLTEVDWPLYLPTGLTIGVRLASTASRLFHEGRLRSVLAGVLAKRGVTAAPVLGAEHILDVRLLNDRLTLALSVAGRPLYRRGYKKALLGTATVKEDIAAAATRVALAWARTCLGPAWTPDSITAPFAGSGTLGFEAAMVLSGMPPSLFFGPMSAEAFPCCPAATLRFARKRLLEAWLAQAAAQGEPTAVHFSEVDPAQCDALHLNIAAFNAVVVAAGGAPVPFSVRCGDSLALLPEQATGARPFVALNPPYGRRLKTASPQTLWPRLASALGAAGAAGYALLPQPSAGVLTAALGKAGMRTSVRDLIHGGKTILLICFCKPSSAD